MEISFTNIMELFINICRFIFHYHLYDLLVNYWANCTFVKNLVGTGHSNFYHEIRYRFGATLHAFYTAFYVTLYLLDMSEPEYLKIIFANSMAYCIYDLYNIFCKTDDEPHRYEFVVHHTLMFMVLFLNYESPNINRINILCTALLTEWSTIFLNFSITMYRSGYGSTMVFKINKWLTLVTYFSFRIVMFAYVLYLTYLESNFFGVIATIFYGLNWFWFYRLIQSASKKPKKVM